MKKRGINNSMLVYIFVCIICLILLSLIVEAPSPQPHNVQGYVFQNNSVTGAGGIPVLINNTNTSDSTLTYTLSEPPVDPFLGSYSATINGSDNDTISVTAWNSTHYGISNSTLDNVFATTYVNVTLNLTRPGETNVTIISPLNNTLYNITTVFNVTANVTIIGGQDGVNCNATISFSNNDVLSLISGQDYTNTLGNISLGSSNITTWTILSNRSGSSNISVKGNCLNDENFDNVNIYTVYNITVQDIFAPIVNLESPINNSQFTATNGINYTVIFKYNVTDDSDITNCSLIINSVVNKTNYTIQKNMSQNFTQTLSVGNHTWNVNCTDNSTSYNVGSSVIFNLTIIPNIAPVISNMAIETTIDLTPGSTKKVVCNGTVTDKNNVSDIKNVNATFYDISVGSNAIDDDNNHYSNSSCTNTSSSTYQENYTCSFDVQYFANNASWECNISAIDNSNVTGSGTISAKITELVAIDISPLVIDYGKLEATETSNDVNTTIANFGNIAMNVTVDGFGTEDGDNSAMNCTKGNVPIRNERYSTKYNTNYNLMINLTDTSVQIVNFTLPQRTNDSDYGSDRNQTYWKLRLPSAIQGTCNGTVIFAAVTT